MSARITRKRPSPWNRTHTCPVRIWRRCIRASKQTQSSVALYLARLIHIFIVIIPRFTCPQALGDHEEDHPNRRGRRWPARRAHVPNHISEIRSDRHSDHRVRFHAELYDVKRNILAHSIWELNNQYSQAVPHTQSLSQ